MCQYFGCNETADFKIIRANTYVCKEHYLLNVLRLGAEFETEPCNNPKE